MSYAPTQNNGLRQDGQPDARVSGNGTESSSVFAKDPQFASEMGKKGGKSSGTTDDSNTTESQGDDYKPKDNNGLRKDGKPDGRVKGNQGANDDEDDE